MDNETKAMLMTGIKTLEQVNHLRAEVNALKEGMILLLKASTTFPAGTNPESHMQALIDEYLSETQPALDGMKKALGL